MTRADLEHLDRDTLIARAEAAGVTRARILTRPELVDELLLRMTADPVARQRSRGLFGVARDLLARVVERGLNLPDAADRIRTIGGEVPSSRRSAPAALPTLTLAEIYAAQGHRDRAVETLEGVLAREPDHAAARVLLAALRDERYPVPAPRLPPEDDDAAHTDDEQEDALTPPVARTLAPEPAHMLDDAPLPPYYDVDECVAIPVDPHTVYVYWEARAATLATLSAGQTNGTGGTLALRVVVVVASWDGPSTSVRDLDVAAGVGDYFLRDLPPASIVRVAIGWRLGDTFLPIAHSPALETPPDSPSPLVADVLVRWTPAGTVAVQPTDPDAASIARALGVVRRDETRARLSARSTAGFLGSSDRWMRVLGGLPPA